MQVLHPIFRINMIYFILSFRVETKVAAFYTGGKVQVKPFQNYIF